MRLQIKMPNSSFEYSARDGASNIVIGNRDRDDITIEGDPEVSGPHVRLERFSGEWSFTNQFSNTGTFHNGEKKYSGDLAVGDVLKVGGTEISVLSLEGQQAAPKKAMYNAHKHTPEDEPHPSPRTKELEDSPPVTLPVTDSETPDERDDDDWEDEEDETGEEEVRAKPRHRHPPSVYVERITHKLMREFEDEHGIDISEFDKPMRRIHDAAYKAVVELESTKSATVEIPFLLADSTAPKHLKTMVERRHLHEEIDHYDPDIAKADLLLRKHERASANAHAYNRKLAAVVGIGGTLFFIFALAFGSQWLFGTGDDEPVFTAEVDDSAEVERAKHKAAEAQMVADVLSLMKRTDRSPQELMGQLDTYEARARQEGYSIGWDYKRTRTHLSMEIYREVTARYREVSDEQFELREAGKYREAQQRVEEFREYLSESTYNQRVITVVELDKHIDGWTESNAKGSSELVAETLVWIASATHHTDYAAAVAAINPVIEDAILSEPVLAKCRQLREQWKDRREEPQPRFEGRDEPYSGPENDLVPNGISGWITNLSKLQRRVDRETMEGLWDGRKFELWGLVGEINTRPRSSKLTVTYTFDLGDGHSISGTYTEWLVSMWSPERMNILLLTDSITVEELSGLLFYAFDRGLADSAREIAWMIRQAAPERHEDLDAILAAKWEVPVPEGGFPERDGRVVPE